MIDQERMTEAAAHMARWLITDDNVERLAGLDALNEAIARSTQDEIDRALPALVERVNAMIAITPKRELH